MKKKSLTNKKGEVRELMSADMKLLRSAAEVLPSALVQTLPKRKPGQRGLQKAPKKVAVTVRYSQEVVEYFKATGEGWQVRVDDALKEWIIRHSFALGHNNEHSYPWQSAKDNYPLRM